MNITSARFANETGDAVEVQTEDRGAVMICLPPYSDNVLGGQEAYAAWIGGGNLPSPYVAPVEDYISLAEAHIDSHFSTGRLLQCKVWLDLIPHAATPKLVSLFEWTGLVTGMALQNQSAFPPPPVTFAAVAQECVPLLAQ
ncbi:MAG: hypothetical protein WCS65_15725 [Verrucomicrobiae bacterium]